MTRRLVAASAVLCATLLAGCSSGGAEPGPGSATGPTGGGAATAKEFTDTTLAQVLAAAPAVAGATPSAGPTAAVDAARKAHEQLAMGARFGEVTPSECKEPLMAHLSADAADGALAVGRSGGLPVELHAYPTPKDATEAVAALEKASAACRTFELSALGRRATGSFEGAPVPGSRADAAHGALMSVTLDGQAREDARVSGAVGNVVVSVLAPKGTPPETARETLDALVTAVRAALAR